jgi:hypothetical protein
LGEIDISQYRDGVSTRGTPESKKGEHFAGLHEAIVASLEKRVFSDLLESPLFSREKMIRDTPNMNKYYAEMAESGRYPADDISAIYDIDGGTEVRRFSYWELRGVLQFVCEQIAQEKVDRFVSAEAVLDRFFAAHFTGNLLEIGRLVEQTFGKGSFRRLGEMQPTAESAAGTLAELRKRRNERS